MMNTSDDERRMDTLEAQIAELRGMLERALADPTLASLANGTPRQAFGIAYDSPLDRSKRYALVRDTGGAAVFVDRSGLSPSDWSDA